MKNSPFFSIIIPNYNGEKYLDECLESICAQTFKNFEVIVIDDGSTDASVLICKRYEEQDFRFKVMQQNNSGPNVARKNGLHHARGEYSIFVDSDDWLERYALEKYYDYLKKCEYDVLILGFYQNFSDSVIYWKNNIPCGQYRKEELKKLYSQLICVKYFEVGIWPAMWSKVFRTQKAKNVIEQVDDTLFYGEDAAFSYLFIMNSENILITEDAFYHYRDTDKSLSKKIDGIFWKKILKLFEWFDENLKELPNEQIEFYKLRNLEQMIDKSLSQRKNIFLIICELKKQLNCLYFKQLIYDANINKMQLRSRLIFYTLKYHIYSFVFLICLKRKVKIFIFECITRLMRYKK